MARTVSSRMPVRDARSSIASAQRAVCGWPWRRPSSQRASRMWTSSQTYGSARRLVARPGVEEHGERPVDVTRGLGQQRQPAGRDALPAGVADLAGPCERLLEACGGGVEVALARARPGRAWPAARAGTRASGRAGPGRTAASELGRRLVEVAAQQADAARASTGRRPRAAARPRRARRGPRPQQRDGARVLGPVAGDGAQVGHRLGARRRRRSPPRPAPGSSQRSARS